MKPISFFLLRSAWIAVGLLTGAAAGYVAPYKRSAVGPQSTEQSDPSVSAVTDHPSHGSSSSGDQTVQNRRSRLRQLMDASARGGGPSLAKAWKATEGDPAARDWLMEVWMREDPAGFLQMLCQENSGGWTFALSARLQQAIPRLVDKDPQAALKLGSTLPPSIGRWVSSQAILKIMETDPRQGLELAAARPEMRLLGLGDLGKIKLTPTDIPLLRALPTSDTVQRLMIKAMAALPKPEAMKLTAHMPFTSKSQLQAELVKNWVRQDPEAAGNYALNGATYGQRLTILEALGASKVETNPADGAAWAEANLSGYTKNRILEEAADKLAKTNPAAAEAIRTRLPRNYDPKAK